jgi:hypothetical protein
MEIAGQGPARDMRALAARIHRRWLEYRRRNPGRTVPITDTLSRILEHEPDYRPLRPRAPIRNRPTLQNPGIFTLQSVADALETTVGDLLGESGYASIRDVVSRTDRRTLRDAVLLLRDLFDLDDDTLDVPQVPPFLVSRAEFIARDYDYPEAELSGLQIIRVIGDAMAPELHDGWRVAVDPERTAPEEGTLIAVYLRGRGGLLGRWQKDGDTAMLVRSNPDVAPIALPSDDEWRMWGTVTKIVDAPVLPR